MHRVVLDPGVFVSALLFPEGPPAQILKAVRAGRCRLVVSPLLLMELGTVLRRPKLQRLISLDESLALDAELRRVAEVVADPEVRERVVRDPEDDYLVALAQAAGVDALVSGDRDLLEVADPRPPILDPRSFLDALRASREELRD